MKIPYIVIAWASTLACVASGYYFSSMWVLSLILMAVGIGAAAYLVARLDYYKDKNKDL